MVKKYFRPFIKAICLSFSLIYCAGNMAAAFVSAENMTEVLAETEENQLEETEQAEPVIQSDKVESEEQSEDVVEETEKKAESDPAVESEEIKKEEVCSPENEKVEEAEPEKQEETSTEENPTEETTKEEIEEKAEFHVSEIKMEKEEYSVGDDAFIFLNGIQAKNLGKLEIRVNGPSYKGYSISGEGMQYRAKEVSDSEHTEYTVTMDAVNDMFTNEKNIQVKVPVEKYQENLHFKVTVTAYDKAGTENLYRVRVPVRSVGLRKKMEPLFLHLLFWRKILIMSIDIVWHLSRRIPQKIRCRNYIQSVLFVEDGS